MSFSDGSGEAVGSGPVQVGGRNTKCGDTIYCTWTTVGLDEGEKNIEGGILQKEHYMQSLFIEKVAPVGVVMDSGMSACDSSASDAEMVARPTDGPRLTIKVSIRRIERPESNGNNKHEWKVNEVDAEEKQ